MSANCKKWREIHLPSLYLIPYFLLDLSGFGNSRYYVCHFHVLELNCLFQRCLTPPGMCGTTFMRRLRIWCHSFFLIKMVFLNFSVSQKRAQTFQGFIWLNDQAPVYEYFIELRLSGWQRNLLSTQFGKHQNLWHVSVENISNLPWTQYIYFGTNKRWHETP